MSQPPRHLVAVWNPSYAQDALDEHMRILVDWNARFRDGRCEADDVYVYWARLRSPNRLHPLPHLADVLKLNDQLDEHDMNLRHETGRMSRELRENLFGDDIWRALEHGTRTFLAVAEATFRARRADPSFDFSGAAVEYAKAVETEVNALLFPRIRKIYSKGNPVGRFTRVNDTELDLGGNVPHQTLGALLTMLTRNSDIRGAVKIAFQNRADFILRELPSHLEPIAAVRNPAAHSARLERDACARLREAIVGIGQERLIPKLARVKIG